MAPITWRNVDGPDFGSASRILSQAQGSFNNAFTLAAQPVLQIQETDAKNWEAMKQYNTDQFLSRLNQLKTPEELAAAQTELQGLRSGFGAQIDMTKVRDAQAALPELLQRRVLTNQAYLDQKKAIEQKPIADALRKEVIAGRGKQAEQAAGIYESAGLIDAGTVANILTDARNRTIQDTQLDREDKLFALKVNEDRRQSAESQARIGLTRAQIEHMNRQDAVDAYKAEAAARQSGLSALQGAKDAVLKDSVLGDGDLSSAQGREAFKKALLETYKLTDNAYNDVIENIFTKYPQGKFEVVVRDPETKKPVIDPATGKPKVELLPIPLRTALAAVGGSSEWGNGAWWSRRGDNAKTTLSYRLSQEDFLRDLKGAITLRDQSSYEILRRAEENAAAKGQPLIIPPGKATSPKR